MPADPTQNVSETQRLETSADDIAHVAPDFDDRKHFNALAIRPQYRISLRLGNIEDLFLNEPNTPAGRMERLQVLGLFYFPLSHAQALRAFNGVPAAPGPPPTPAVPGAWTYFKNSVLTGVSDADADTQIQDMLKNRIVDGGALPAATAEGGTPAAANFAKLRVPGGYTFMDAWAANVLDLNRDPAYALGFGASQYTAEGLYYRDNPILRKVPLVAFVEKKQTSDGTWQPANDVQVYFQLLDPDPLPAFVPGTAANQQINRPPLRATSVGPLPAPAPANLGPAAITTREEVPTGARAPDPADPQRGNAPNDRGGEAGQGSLTDSTDVAGVLFETTARDGFNQAHGARALPHDPYPVAEAGAAGGQHAHSVKAKTNAQGEAGAIFMPSRCGGDRYRFRAYVGPDTIASDGSDAAAVRVDTGTLVVWRNMRVSRYVQQPGAAVDATLMAEATPAPYNVANVNDYLSRARIVTAGANAGIANADFSGTGTASAVFDGPIRNWARAFVELEIDRAAQANLPQVLSAADWQAARQQGFNDGVVGAGAANLNLNLNLTQLFHMSTATITVNNSVAHMPMRTLEAYNAAVPPQQRIVDIIPAAARHAASLRNTRARIVSLIETWVMNGFLRSLSSNGYRPGLTVVSAGFGTTWQILRREGRHSGIAHEYRGAYVWLGASGYPTTMTVPQPGMPYGFTSNTTHEMGHCCYRQHGPGFDPGSGAPGGANAGVHDVQTNNESLCVMSYQTCEGQFCGKCLFAFRGWDIGRIPP